MQRHLWAAKFEFNIDFKRENFYKFKLIYDSNFPAHRWRCKHLKYLDRLDVLIETLKSQITLPPSPLDSVFSFSEHLELGKKLCMYLVEVVAEEGTQFTGELHRNTTFYFVTKNYPWLRAEWTNRRIFGD